MQWILYTPPNKSGQTITLSIGYTNNKYILLTSYNTGDDWGNPLSCDNKTNTQFYLTTKSTWSTQTKISILTLGN